MKQTLLILALVLISSCSLSEKSSPNIVSYDDLIVYNNDFNSLSSLIIDKDGVTVDSITSRSDLIISSYFSSSICFLSPSKDSIISKGNIKKTGIVDYGAFSYSYAPTSGYNDMEYPNAGHWYYLMTEESIFARFYLKSYSSDSILIYLELLSDSGSFFGE
ncbi:MAG: hypothetical protein AB7T10_05835 [bacterium]